MDLLGDPEDELVPTTLLLPILLEDDGVYEAQADSDATCVGVRVTPADRLTESVAVVNPLVDIDAVTDLEGRDEGDSVIDALGDPDPFTLTDVLPEMDGEDELLA